jgi:hypothetical protein
MHFTAFIALFLVFVSAVPAPGNAHQGASLIRRQPKGDSKSKGSKSSKGDDTSPSSPCPFGMHSSQSDSGTTFAPVSANVEQEYQFWIRSNCAMDNGAVMK